MRAAKRLATREASVASFLWILATVCGLPLLLFADRFVGCVQLDGEPWTKKAGWSVFPLGQQCRTAHGVGPQSMVPTAYVVVLVVWAGLLWLGHHKKLIRAAEPAG